MSCIVYQTDKKTGIKYAYESFSYWDKDKKQPRSKRKYIGKVDPDTGEIIPAKTRREKTVKNDAEPASDNSLSQLYAELEEKERTISSLRNDITRLENRCHSLEELLRKINSISGELDDV